VPKNEYKKLKGGDAAP